MVKFKRRGIRTGVLCIVLGKFDYWHKFSHIILFEIDKYLKVSFHSTDLSFHLIINMRIKDG